LWLGVALAVGLMAFALRGVSPESLWLELSGADYRWLAPAAGLIVVGQVGRALRWRALFGAQPRPGPRRAFAILSIGYLVSNVLPLRAGDAVRAWLVDTRTDADGATALATVVVERAVDLVTILLLLGLWVPGEGVVFAQRYSPSSWLTADTLRWLVVGGAAGMYAGLTIVGRIAAPAGAAVRGLLRRTGLADASRERVAAGVVRFLAAFGVLREGRVALEVFAWSIGVWWIGAAGYWLVFRAFHLELPLAAAVFAMCASAVLAALLPPSPGYVGSFHASVRESLALYAGVPPEVGAGYAIVLHGVTLAVLIVLGGASLMILGVTPERPPR
jgi:uncharacterized protein (TIRG00374 family)